MTQYVFNSGATLNVTSIPEFANLNTQQLPMEEIRILVDTSIARTVILPYSTLFPVRNVKITIVDITGNAATNNVTVQASTGSPNDTIIGSSSFTMNTNYQASRFEVLNTNQWFAVNASGGGGSSGSRTLITDVDFVGSDYTNAALIGLTPFIDFNVWVNVGANVGGTGTIVNQGDVYTFDSTTGTLTMEPDNYLIQIY